MCMYELKSVNDRAADNQPSGHTTFLPLSPIPLPPPSKLFPKVIHARPTRR